MSYISQLNLLNDDSPIPISEESLTEELSLWANAQFTFDTKPGTALPDDSLKPSADTQDLFLTDFSSLGQTNTTFDAIMPYMTPTSHTSYLLPTNIVQQPLLQTQQPLLNSTTTFPRIAPAPIPKSEAAIQEKPVIVQKPTAPKKRKQPDSSESLDASDEDKRRRNTAASARFRMKKKLREQVLEKTAKEMTVKAETLEKRVNELEMEVKWLRALVVEKDPSLLTQTLS
ncbi:hypothetical protein K501DRAFT_325101 [Backusella circina FSU 941]|nr:hypothetical protein K501DRAFT_325101 [Backusella circina FSU 941]